MGRFEDLLPANGNHLTIIIALNNLTNVINKPTRITDTSSTLIDPVLVTEYVHVLHFGYKSLRYRKSRKRSQSNIYNRKL